jgi:hypothetical protein
MAPRSSPWTPNVPSNVPMHLEVVIAKLVTRASVSHWSAVFAVFADFFFQLDCKC